MQIAITNEFSQVKSSLRTGFNNVILGSQVFTVVGPQDCSWNENWSPKDCGVHTPAFRKRFLNKCLWERHEARLIDKGY